MIGRSLLTTNVSPVNTQTSRDRAVTPLSNVIYRNRVGLSPTARHTSIDPRRTSEEEPLGNGHGVSVYSSLSGSDTITVAVRVSGCARPSVN
jgi:hypothetical protein